MAAPSPQEATPRPGAQVALSAKELALAREAAARAGISVEALLARCAVSYARDHGFQENGQITVWQRKPPFWGPAPVREGLIESLFVPLEPLALTLARHAAAYFKFQAPKGGFQDVSLGEYVAGAMVRMVSAGKLPAAEAKRAPEPAPVERKAPVPAEPKRAPPKASQKEGVYVLLVAMAVTAVVLGTWAIFRGRSRSAAGPAGPQIAAPQQPAHKPATDQDPLAAHGLPPLEPEDKESRPRSLVYSAVLASPSKTDESNIDALLESKYGRPTVSAAAAQRPGEGPAWAGGKPAPARPSYAALGELMNAVPYDQRYDVAIAVAVADVATVYPVPPALVKGIIRRESDFNPKAVSKTGALGLMQVMPFNAERVNVTKADLLVPEKNILAGVRLLAVLLKYYQGDVISALTAYNARPRKLGAPIPRNGETPGYVAAVLRFYEQYNGAPLRQNAPPAPTPAPPPFVLTGGADSREAAARP